MERTRAAVPSLALIMCSCTFALHAQTFVNPGFESLATGWTDCPLEVNTRATYGGAGGGYVAEVDGHMDPGASDDRLLCQTVDGFTVGNVYTLEFDATRRPGGNTPSSVSVSVFIDGNAMEAVVTRAGGWNMQHEIFVFTATQSTHTLTISPNFQGSYGMLFDNFSYGTPGLLHVELVRFDARPEGRGVHVEWTTASENGNACFQVERSTDRSAWSVVAIVPGAGSSMGFLDYQAMDPGPHHGVSYYRLLQVGTDGSIARSEAKAVEYTAPDDVSLWPNPAVDRVHLAGTDAAVDGVEVIDVRGRVMPVHEERDEDRLVLHVGGLPAGQYFVRGNDDGAAIGRFIKR